MHRILQVSLNNFTYQVDEEGYNALRAYLDMAAARLRQNPDKEEILRDLEQSIGEKCAARVEAGRNEIRSEVIKEILEAMGPVAGDAGAEPADDQKIPGGRPPRLYRIQEGAMVAGVCNGLGTYLNIDVAIVRVGFVVVTVLSGFFVGVLAYLILAIMVPVRDSQSSVFPGDRWREMTAKISPSAIVVSIAIAVLFVVLVMPQHFMMVGPGVFGLVELLFSLMLLAFVFVAVAGIVLLLILLLTFVWKYLRSSTGSGMGQRL